MKYLKGTFIKNALAYSGTNVISQAALFAQGLFLRRLLAPEVMGLWNFASVAKGFASGLTLGMLSGAGRELPVLKGRADAKGQAEVRSATLAYSIAEVLIAAAGVAVYALLRMNALAPGEAIALLLTALLLVFTRFQETYITFFQGAQQYVPLSRLLLVNSLVLALLLPIGALVYGVWGIFLAALAAEGIRAVLTLKYATAAGVRAGWKWNARILRNLLAYGIGYKIADYPVSLFLIVDLLWVTWFMDLGALAIYAMARSFYSQASEITIRVGTVFMTRDFERYGEGGRTEKRAADLWRFINFQMLVALPLVGWAVFTVAPFIIRQVTPAYSEGILPMKLLLIASFFDLRNNNLFTLWLAEKRLFDYGVANLFSLVAMSAIFVTVWFAFNYRGMAAVAGAFVAGNIVSFIWFVLTAGRELFGRTGAVKLAATTIGVVLWLTLSVGFVTGVGSDADGFYNDLLASLKDGGLTFLAMAPVVCVGVKACLHERPGAQEQAA